MARKYEHARAAGAWNIVAVTRARGFTWPALNSEVAGWVAR